MPVYQYACTECAEQLEMRQSFTDDALTVCPACAGRLRKVLTAVGVVFKGSGFYRTDSRSAVPAAESGTSDGSSGTSDSDKPGPDKKDSEKKDSPATKDTSTTSAKESTSPKESGSGGRTAGRDSTAGRPSESPSGAKTPARR